MTVKMSDSRRRAVRRIAILMSVCFATSRRLFTTSFAWRKLEGKRNKRHRKRLQAQLVARRASVKLTEVTFFINKKITRLQEQRLTYGNREPAETIGIVT